MPLILTSTTASLGRLEMFDLYGRGKFSAISEGYTKDSLLFDLNATNLSSYPGSGTTWTDLTGNGYNSTLVNDPTYNSANGGSIGFDGSNDYVTMSGLDLRRNFSLEVWAKFNDANRTNGLFGQGIAAANQSINIWQGSTTIDFRMYFNDYSISFTPLSNRWYHYVFTYNHSSPYTKQIYVDGVLIGESGAQGQYAGTGTFYIGSIGTTTYVTDGNISIVRGYSKILTIEEINKNFNGFRRLYGV